MAYGQARLNKDLLEWNRFIDSQVLFLRDLYLYYLKRNGKLADKIKQTAKELKQWGYFGQTDTKKHKDPNIAIRWGRNRV